MDEQQLCERLEALLTARGFSRDPSLRNDPIFNARANYVSSFPVENADKALSAAVSICTKVVSYDIRTSQENQRAVLRVVYGGISPQSH